MKSIFQQRLVIAALANLTVVAYGGTIEAPVITVPESARKPHWELQAGVGVRQSFDFSTRVAPIGGASSSGDADTILGFVGPADADADRSYDDGFVNKGPVENLTSWWGYDNASQVRPSSQTWGPEGTDSLYLSRSIASGLGEARRKADSDPNLFPYIELSRLWTLEDRDSEIGLTLGYSRVSAESTGVQSVSSYLTQVQDEYYLYGVVPPAAGYDGPALPPGPLLDNQPTKRVIGETATGDSGAVVRTHSELTLHTLSAGGVWRWIPQESGFLHRMHLIGADLQAGATLNRADLSYRHSATVGSTVVNSASADKYRIMPGLYASVDTNFELRHDDLFLTLTGRYDDAGQIETRINDSYSTVDLNGWSLMLGLTKRW